MSIRASVSIMASVGVYLCTQYALLNVTVQMHPSTLYHQLRWSKVTPHEEEPGIAGWVAHVYLGLYSGA